MFDRAVSRGDMEQYFAALQQFIYVSRDPKD
jgi:hypothetical protein